MLGRIWGRGVLAAAGLLFAACGGEPAAVEVAPLRRARPPGLIARAQVEQATPSPHLVELALADEGYLYLANSNDGLGVYRLLPEGGLELRLGQPADAEGQLRCTSLAVHQASDSLYCGSDGWLGIQRWAIEDREQPVLDGPDFNPPLTGLRVHDLLVIGEQLLMARYDRGLAWAEIDGNGQLGALVERPEVGNLRKLARDEAGRLWALSVDRGLLVFEPEPGGGWSERWSLEVDGPALGLGVDGARAALGLGSAGVAVVELDAGGLTQTHRLEPPGVVTAADLRGEILAAITLTGVFAYDLRPSVEWPEDPHGEVDAEAADLGGARLLGFWPAGPWDHPGGKGAMLDGRFVDGDAGPELIVSDWSWVERFVVDPEGFPSGVDLARGVFVAGEDQDIGLALRNPTPFRQRVELQRVGADAFVELELGAYEERVETLAAGDFELDAPSLVVARVFDGDELVAAPGFTVLRRPPLDERPILGYGRPPPGSRFPDIAMATGSPGAVEALGLPTPGERQRLVFYAIDCAAMWPAVEDLLWQLRSGRRGPASVVLAAHIDPSIESARERWGLDDASWGYFAPFALPPEIAALNPYEDLYEDGFVIYELPAAAHHPTDYLIGEDGQVLAVEREYRGLHALGR